jgi:hypothetical protein
MKREVITLCGSTRFVQEFKDVERALTLMGKIPLPPAIYGKAEGLVYSEKLSKELFDLHLDKIKISDSIFVIDPDSKLGDSTTKEIEFAKKEGKSIKYYSKEKKEINKTLNSLNSSIR